MLTDPEIKKAITNGYFNKTDKEGQLKRDAEGNAIRYLEKLDDEGLYMELLQDKAAGKWAGYWRIRYLKPLNLKPTRMSLTAPYPFISLTDARDEARDVRKGLAQNPPIDPIEKRRNEKAAARAKRPFEEVIKEWFAAFREHAKLSQSTHDADIRKRDQLIALFGSKLIGSLTTAEISDALIKIANADGNKVKARQLRTMLSEVFIYAITKKDCTANPAASSVLKLPKFKSTKLVAIVRPREVGQLMQDIRDYDGRIFTRAALMVLAYTFVRPANIARMEWDEVIDGVWIIPAGKMKMKREHRVPLSSQVLAILAELRKLTNSRFVFSTNDKPLGAKTLNRALQAMGYSKRHCAHGFRSTASTLLNASLKFRKEIVELQLAHGEEDKVADAYKRLSELDDLVADGDAEHDIFTKLWEVRAEMMQFWANRLDGLRDAPPVIGTSNVVPLKQAA